MQRNHNIVPPACNNQPSITNLFQLHPKAASSDVSAHLYGLSKQAETIIGQLEDLTEIVSDLADNSNAIGWLLATLSEINRQQSICSEYLDDHLTRKVKLEVAA